MKKPYKKGDIVFIGDLPDHMRYFRYQNKHVVILYSYHDHYGDSERNKYDYCVMGADGNNSAWYPHYVMSPVELVSGLTEEEWKKQQKSKLSQLDSELD